MVVTVGVTAQVDPEPAQVPPVQMKPVAGGLHVAVKVELPPAVTLTGLALRVQTGAEIDGAACVTV